jgi:hypothetical protein
VEKHKRRIGHDLAGMPSVYLPQSDIPSVAYRAALWSAIDAWHNMRGVNRYLEGYP